MNRSSKLLLAPLAVLALGGYAYYPPEPPVPAGDSIAAAAAAATTLNAVVSGAGASGISLKKGGKTFKTLKAGKYKIIVDDRTAAHNFHLKGPSLNKLTTVGQVAKVTWNVTLKKGKFTFVCDPHQGVMKGSFTVN